VQSTVDPHPTNVPTPDAVSVPLEFSVNVTDVRVNTQLEQVPSAEGGQRKLPFQVAVEPDPVAVTLSMVPSVQASLVIRSLPDTAIGSVPAGTKVLPARGHVIEKGPLQVLAKPASSGVLPPPSLPPPQLPISRATAKPVRDRFIFHPLRAEARVDAAHLKAQEKRPPTVSAFTACAVYGSIRTSGHGGSPRSSGHALIRGPDSPHPLAPCLGSRQIRCRVVPRDQIRGTEHASD
jgi:hypothetical protein